MYSRHALIPHPEEARRIEEDELAREEQQRQEDAEEARRIGEAQWAAREQYEAEQRQLEYERRQNQLREQNKMQRELEAWRRNQYNEQFQRSLLDRIIRGVGTYIQNENGQSPSYPGGSGYCIGRPGSNAAC